VFTTADPEDVFLQAKLQGDFWIGDRAVGRGNVAIRYNGLAHDNASWTEISRSLVKSQHHREAAVTICGARAGWQLNYFGVKLFSAGNIAGWALLRHVRHYVAYTYEILA
jgi:hypothetical protein